MKREVKSNSDDVPQLKALSNGAQRTQLRKPPMRKTRMPGFKSGKTSNSGKFMKVIASAVVKLPDHNDPSAIDFRNGRRVPATFFKLSSGEEYCAIARHMEAPEGRVVVCTKQGCMVVLRANDEQGSFVLVPEEDFPEGAEELWSKDDGAFIMEVTEAQVAFANE